MDLYDVLKTQFEAVLAHYRAALADKKLTLLEKLKLAALALGSLVKVAELGSDSTGEEKKAAVTKMALRLWDEVLAPIDIPRVPDLLEQTVVDPVIRMLIPLLVNLGIDTLVSMFNHDKTWIPEPTPPADPAPAPVPADPGVVPANEPADSGLPPGFVPY